MNEIEKYQEIVTGLRERAREKDDEIERLKALVTEQACALDLVDPDKPQPSFEAALAWTIKLPDLQKRAWEATQ